MASKLQIWNLALANISQNPSVQGVNEDSKEANFCRVYYDDVLKSGLQKHDWNFARKTLTLAEIADPPKGWGYQYGYPSDCLQARSICKAIRTVPEIPFEVAVKPDDGLIGSSDKKVIWTDQGEAALIYTYNQLDPTFFSQGFTIFLSWALSAVIAMPITQKESVKTAAGQEAERQLLIAKAENMNEGRKDKNDRKANEFSEAHG
jgi:hypothetical protein